MLRTRGTIPPGRGAAAPRPRSDRVDARARSRASIDAGIPVVSLSLGDTARFVLGGLRRKEPMTTLMLASGDGFVFGGPARLRYHGVTRIVPGTAPAALGIEGRINLTFRQY